MANIDFAALGLMLWAFFNSKPLLILLLALVLDLVAGVVRAWVEERFTVLDAFKGVVWKPVMYLSIFSLLKLGGAWLEFPAENAVIALFVKEFVSMLLNWKAITVATNDPSGPVVDALIHLFSLDKFLKIPTK